MTNHPSPSIATKSFLVIDDDAFFREMVGLLLERLGASSVRAASSGLEALGDIDVNGPPHVILCDLNMPEMDGVEFLRHLVERKFAGAVALISGEDKRILETVVRLGMAQNLNILGAIAKPVTATALIDIVARSDLRHPDPVDKPEIQITPDDLRRALADNLITTAYQPKVSVGSGKLEGVETLVRWTDPEKGIIPPPQFIALAEELDLIDEITERVFTIAMEQCRVWSAAGLDLKVAVNVSADNLKQLAFPELLHDIARRTGVDPRRVVLELTETRLMTDAIKCLETLTRLRLKGFELSIDDFGTGHSSLAQLQRIPFTELKVDRAFVHGASRDEVARSILDSSLSLARRLGLRTVAEGAETQEDWDLVAALGVDLVQGYFVSRPLPGDRVPAWFEAWNNRA
jgi:EAL domain-containing protein (putative c-di-GMP-specific phosphodiesterase class I)/ActR/RegA family two-component response regulator